MNTGSTPNTSSYQLRQCAFPCAHHESLVSCMLAIICISSLSAFGVLRVLWRGLGVAVQVGCGSRWWTWIIIVLVHCFLDPSIFSFM